LHWIALCRPKQWVKNSFLLAPVLFSGAFRKPPSLLDAAAAVACFCLLSSSVYCLNDLLDAEADRQHPRKRNRPIASGKVSPAAAIVLVILLTVGSFGLAAWFLPTAFLAWALAYLINSTLYSLFLKHRVIVDVLSIAIGFVIRLGAGCAAVSVEPSQWLFVCGFSLAMMLGFGKRRLELAIVKDPSAHRKNLESYTVEKVNMLLAVSSAVCLLAYMLYTIDPETVDIHNTKHLIYSTPFVAYGLFRYVFKVQEARHDGPLEVLISDWVFTLNSFLWLAVVVVILYVLK